MIYSNGTLQVSKSDLNKVLHMPCGSRKGRYLICVNDNVIADYNNAIEALSAARFIGSQRHGESDEFVQPEINYAGFDISLSVTTLDCKPTPYRTAPFIQGDRTSLLNCIALIERDSAVLILVNEQGLCSAIFEWRALEAEAAIKTADLMGIRHRLLLLSHTGMPIKQYNGSDDETKPTAPNDCPTCRQYEGVMRAVNDFTDKKMGICSECNGRGTYTMRRGYLSNEFPCPKCNPKASQSERDSYYRWSEWKATRVR